MGVTIGVLALQGCVEPHKRHIEALGARFLAAKTASDFKVVDGIIVPGGESTTILHLLDSLNLYDALGESLNRVPSWGVCAGAILLAKTVLGARQKSFGCLDISVLRNAYGRQADSFVEKI